MCLQSNGPVEVLVGRCDDEEDTLLSFKVWSELPYCCLYTSRGIYASYRENEEVAVLEGANLVEPDQTFEEDLDCCLVLEVP